MAVVAHADHATPEWLTGVLNAAGHDGTVKAVQWANPFAKRQESQPSTANDPFVAYGLEEQERLAFLLDGFENALETQDPETIEQFRKDLYLFVSRNRIRAKVLHWDGTGLCVYAKRLEKGKFASLWSGVEGEPLRLTTSELSLFLEGSRLVGKISLSPPEMTQFSLATRSRP